MVRSTCSSRACLIIYSLWLDVSIPAASGPGDIDNPTVFWAFAISALTAAVSPRGLTQSPTLRLSVGSCHPATMYDSIPEELWSGIFDYLDLSGLLHAMLIDRRSRRLALAHRTYWRDITLDYEAEDPLLQSVSLFKTRITRSAARPIKVSISLHDPSDILDDVRDHLFHTELLDIQSSPLHAARIVGVLTSPAPILVTLNLSMFLACNAEPDLVFLPHTLFEGHAPALRRLSIRDIGLPNPLPPVFEHLERLNNGFFWPGFTAAVPSPFARCPNLRILILGGPVDLNDGAFWVPENWRGIDRLLFESAAATTWHELGLPISQVPNVGVRGPTAASAAALFSTLR